MVRALRFALLLHSAALAACGDRAPVVPATPTDPFAPVPHEPDTIAYEPRERRERAGLEALRVVTEELDANDLTWQATHTWMWPSKLRSERRPSGGSVAQYAFVHRSGDDVWLRAPLESRSRAANAAERRAVALENGLRTAALLWPDGDTWTIEDGAAYARSSDALIEDVQFDAELDGEGRPRRIEARDTRAFVELGGWRAIGGRTVPCELHFDIGGLAWSESVTKFVECSPFDDVYFVPVELARDAAAPASDAADEHEVRRIDALPRGACAHESLAAGTTVEQALLAADRRRAELGNAGPAADVLVELAADLSAAALVVRLAEDAGTPAGFTVPPPRRALSLRVDATTPAALAEALIQLTALLPAGVAPDPAYLWSGADGRHLVLPWR
jgi:hypothetical protein